MKKNLKIVSVAAAALMAVAPVVTTAATVNAANSQPVVNQPITNDSTLYVNLNNQGSTVSNGVYTLLSQINAASFTNVSEITGALEKIQYYSNSDTNAVYNPSVKTEDIKDQLTKLGIKYNDKTGAIEKGTLPTNFNISITLGINGKAVGTAVAQFYTTPTPTVSTDSPVFKVNETGEGSKVANDGAYYTVAANSNFNPLNFVTSDGKQVSFSAQQASQNTFPATISVASNPVDTSKEGHFYTVKLKAENTAKKTSTLSYYVLVVSNGQQTLSTDAATYGIYGNLVQATGNTLKAGTKIYVGSTTRTINNVSYTKVSTTSKADADSATNNVWVQTSALAAAAPTQEQSVSHMVMRTSNAYDKDGKYLGHKYYAYNNIDYVPTVKTIHGKTYYKVAGKNEYVRVTNITGTPRTLYHNAYVYATSKRRSSYNGKRKLYKGEHVNTYGAAIRFKNGKRYYRIGGPSKQYVKVANF